MRLYSESEHYKLYHGNMLDMCKVIEPCTIDSIVTDPPYELGFMNKGWDSSGIAFQAETWRKCLQVLKPGGYLLAFGGSRTYHRIACAIEDAGFEIRDTIMWIYGSGFPKSMDLSKSIEAKLTTGSANTQEFKNLNGERADRGTLGFTTMQHEQGARPNDYGKLDVDRLGKLDATTDEAKQWSGWGTALKPAFEPVIVARKPCVGSTTDNVLEFGVGGINIDECRIGTEYIGGGTAPSFKDAGKQSKETIGIDKLSFGQTSNVERIEYEGHEGRFPSNVILTYDKTDREEVTGGLEDCARYFYTAKASRRDRGEGNTHPTVKPTDLMQYLIRLVTPNGGAILDPFNGSGSTGKAVMYENNDRDKDYRYVGIELTEEYLPIAKARIEYASNDKEFITYDEEDKPVVKKSEKVHFSLF